ncbi:MAG: GHKL domain-containing protein [Oscillospiraceae bacterium]|nr:GHKL domain-containing protein [Oscillospiraceae bacterium]
MEKLLIDALGALIGITAAIVLYGTFWTRTSIKDITCCVIICILTVINAFSTLLLQSTVILASISTMIMFITTLFFVSSISSKVLFTLIITAVLFVAEQFVGIVFVNYIRVPIEVVQNNITLYMMGVIISKLLALFIVLFLRAIMKGYKRQTNNRFNVIMAVMPLQSIIICFLVSIYSINADMINSSPLGIIAILISLLLVYITMFLIRNQQKALQYKSEYELSQLRLEMQIEHYQKLYTAQREVKAIRHNISDKLVAISGLLSSGLISEALERIDGIDNEVKKTATIIDTGFPPIDAVINAKIEKAKANNINIRHKIIIDNALHTDQFDIAILIANALDNAVEGILRSNDVERVIKLDFISVPDYISLLIENYSSVPIIEGFKTVKQEKSSHGFGIEQMKAIAKKYDGDIYLIYDSESYKFTVEILLKNKSN